MDRLIDRLGLAQNDLFRDRATLFEDAYRLRGRAMTGGVR